MFISVKPYRATVLLDSDGEYLLIFSCRARDESGVLEIDKDYIFASRKNRSLLSRRHSCQVAVRIKRRSSTSDIVAADIKLSADKVGELSFFRPIKSGLFTPADAAFLDATLFVEDQLFDNLMSALLSGRRPESLQLDIEKEGVIKYGWEPDGSRMEWKTQNAAGESRVDVSSFSLMYALFA